MAEALLRHLRVNTGRKKMRRMRVPQVVKPDPREIARLGHQPDEFMREAIWLKRPTARNKD
jgi:hypothetical protein